MGSGLASLTRRRYHVSNAEINSLGRSSTSSTINNLDILCYYVSLKSAFAGYLDEKGLREHLLLYEAIVQSELSSDKEQQSQVENLIQTINLASSSSKGKRRSLLQNNQTEDTAVHFSMTKRDVERILLPILDEFQQTDSFAAAIRPRALRISISQKQKMALLASSHPLVSQIVNKMLCELHYQVRIVDTGDAALAELMSQSFDYAILSLELTGKSGLKVAQEVVRLEHICSRKIENYTRPTFVYMTIKHEEHLKDSALRAGFKGGLVIPFKQSNLEELVPSNNFMRSMSRKISL